jgi:predicted thioesterase
VSDSVTADRFQNRGVRVLATPILGYWMESAAVNAIANQLEPGEATVGTQITLEHLAATPVGMRVTVRAEVSSVDGRRIAFRTEAHDERELIARGTHERVVVDLERFLARVSNKANQTTTR